MRKPLKNIQKALTRKAGPLPVWAWALILGAALYVYRMRKSGSPTVAAAQDPSQVPAGTPMDPVTLQPGESVYDPNSGGLIGTAPEQQPPNTPQLPITLEPGEKIYDPNTGQLIGGDAPAPDASGAGNTGAAAATKGAAKPRHRTRHRRNHHRKQPKATHGKSHPRSDSHTRTSAHGKSHHSASPPKHKPRGRPTPPKPVARKPVAHKPKPRPVVRAHPRRKRHR